MPVILRKYREDFAYAAVLVGLVLLFMGLLLAQTPYYFWTDDFQSYFLPVLKEISDSLYAGEVPLLSRRSLMGGAFLGEYQPSIFNLPLIATVVVLFATPLPLIGIATALIFLHLCLLGLGAYVLARQRQLKPIFCLFCAVVAVFSVWGIQFDAKSWVAGLFSFAYLPWAWWAMEINGARSLRVTVIGIAVYSVLSLGWPFSNFALIVLTLTIVLSKLRSSPLRSTCLPICLGWLAGFLLAAPAWLPFLEHFFSTSRFVYSQARFSNSWSVPLEAYLGMILPSRMCHWLTFDTFRMYGSQLLFCGWPPIIALVIALRQPGFLRRNLNLFALLILSAVLASAPGFSVVRWPFRWLPLFHLAMGVLGAEALSQVLGRTSQTNSSAWGSFYPDRNLGTVGLCLFAVVGSTAYLGNIEADVKLTMYLGVLAMAWLGDGFLSSSHWRAALAIGITFCSLLLVHGRFPEIVPTWTFTDRLRSHEPLQKNRRYFSWFSHEDLFEHMRQPNPDAGSLLRPGNTAMFANLDFLNGYSPLGHAGVSRHFELGWVGFIEPHTLDRLLEEWRHTDALLKKLAVDGLVVSKAYGRFVPRLPSEWQKVFENSEAAVFHRLGNLQPRVASDNPLVAIQSIHEERLHTSAEVENRSGEAASVYFSRLAIPGYTATYNGKPLSVHTEDLLVPAVRIPAHSKGKLLLVYFPRSLFWGLILSGLGVLLLFGYRACGVSD